MTLIATNHVSDELYDEVSRYFAEDEIATLLMAIVTINSWKRIAIATRTIPGSYEPQALKQRREQVVWAIWKTLTSIVLCCLRSPIRQAQWKYPLAAAGHERKQALCQTTGLLPGKRIGSHCPQTCYFKEFGLEWTAS